MRRTGTRDIALLLWAVGATVVLSGCGLLSGSRADFSGCDVIVHPGESIQEAIDAAPDGAVIGLAAGTWEESLVINRPMTLRGQGPQRTVIRSSSLAHPTAWVSGGDVVLEGIAFTAGSGGSVTGQPPSAGVSISGTAAVRISRCWVVGNSPSGMYVAGSATVTVEKSELNSNTRHGLVASDSAYVVLSESSLTGNRGGGIAILGTAHVLLDGTEIVRNDGPGVWVRQHGRLTARLTTIDRSQGEGVLAQDDAMLDVDDSTILRNADPGIRLLGRATLDIKDSQIRANWHGIDVLGDAVAVVSRCSIAANRWNGIRGRGQGVLEVTDSYIGESQDGIAITGSMQVTLMDNRIERCAGPGLYAFDGVIEGEGNRFSGNGISLLGRIPASVRMPLREPTEQTMVWPNSDHPSLQEAVDALLPGGTLQLVPGEHVGGVVLDKAMRIVGQEGVSLVSRASSIPVLSLLGSADVEISHVRILRGSEGVAAYGDARVIMAECSVEANGIGLGFWNTASATISRTTVADSQEVGIQISDHASVTVAQCTLIRNTNGAVSAGGRSVLVLENSLIEKNGWGELHRIWGGVLLTGSARAHMEGNEFVANTPYGIALYGIPCMGRGRERFFGEVTGQDNVFRDSWRRETCPADILHDLAREIRSSL